MVRLHLYKSEIGLAVTAIEDLQARRKPDGTEEDLYKDVLRKLKKAYNTAER